MKNYLHLIIINMFFIHKLVKHNLLKKQLYHHPLECLAGHRFPKFQWSFRLISHQSSTRAYFVGLIFIKTYPQKSRSEVLYQVGLITREARYY